MAPTSTPIPAKGTHPRIALRVLSGLLAVAAVAYLVNGFTVPFFTSCPAWAQLQLDQMEMQPKGVCPSLEVTAGWQHLAANADRVVEATLLAVAAWMGSRGGTGGLARAGIAVIAADFVPWWVKEMLTTGMFAQQFGDRPFPPVGDLHDAHAWLWIGAMMLVVAWAYDRGLRRGRAEVDSP